MESPSELCWSKGSSCGGLNISSSKISDRRTPGGSKHHPFEAQQFVAQQSSAQVLEARPPSDGKLSASREDMRWRADLLDFSKLKNNQEDTNMPRPSSTSSTSSSGSRNLPLKKNTQVLTAYRQIIGQNKNVHPKEVSWILEKSSDPPSRRT